MAAHRSTAKHSSRSTNTRSRSTHATARRTVTGHAISPSSAADDLGMATATDSFDSPNLVATTGRVRATRRSTTPRRSLTTACWPRSGRSETPRQRAGRELRGQLQDRADRRPHLAYAIAARARRREVPRPTQPQPPARELGDLPPAEFEAEAPRAQAAPEASEGPAIDGRPLALPGTVRNPDVLKEGTHQTRIRGTQPGSFRPLQRPAIGRTIAARSMLSGR